ncbi:alcohol dehydrogenase catalytic domain-containing protein [Zavarzinia sp.]|uniref:alcohol dehydrogenase catalytic domain-containing protein n=1 Tax=Zavarzinia sp. TaxID=2027920 RepID=UPI003566E377
MPSTAAVIKALKQPLAFECREIPEPGPGEVLIRVAACGVCHSDLHAADGDWDPPPNVPIVPGHEVTGHVLRLGTGVNHLSVGDPVGVAWMGGACGRCAACLSGMETICPSGEATGYTRDGGYATHLVARADFVLPLPKGADLVALAPILCAGVTTYRALKRAGAKAGDFVGVIGVGGLGHVAIQYAKAMGYRAVAVDLAPEKLELALRLGAEAAVHAGPDAVARVMDETGGGLHAALVTATAPAAFEQALDMTRPGGTTVFVGLPGGAGDRIGVSIASLANWERSIRGSNVGTRADLAEAMGFALRGLVHCTTETMPFSAANEALERLRQGTVTGRLVLTMEE